MAGPFLDPASTRSKIGEIKVGVLDNTLLHIVLKCNTYIKNLTNERGSSEDVLHITGIFHYLCNIHPFHIPPSWEKCRVYTMLPTCVQN